MKGEETLECIVLQKTFGVVMIFTSTPPHVGKGGSSRSDSRLASWGTSRDNGDETRGTSEARDRNKRNC